MQIRIDVYPPEKIDGSFFAIMGKFFANKEYAEEMGGYPFYNLPGKTTWFLMFVDNNLVGFCAEYEEKKHLFYDNFYILKEERGKGYSKILFEYRLKHSLEKKKEIRALCSNPSQIKNYEENLFQVYGRKGHYLRYKRIVK